MAQFDVTADGKKIGNADLLGFAICETIEEEYNVGNVEAWPTCEN